MKLLSTLVNENFEQTVESWVYEIGAHSALFHVYIPYDLPARSKRTASIRDALKRFAPSVPVIGCSATGEIFEGQLNDLLPMVSVMIFEDSSTRVEVLPYYEKTHCEDAKWVLEHAKGTPDLRGIEIITAASYQRLEYAGSVIDALPDEVEIFGGVAVGFEDQPAFVFANDADITSDGSAFVFYSGPELHLQTNRMFGWKPIGYPLKVTRSEGPVVYEIDGKPAYDVYHHYLHIKKDDNFFYDALDFPWEIRVDEETDYLRHAKSVNPDGSIVMSTDIPQGSEIRLTYGDPRRIMAHTKQTALLMRDFAPEAVLIINCMGRKLFWSDREDGEIAVLSKIMNTTGFSALGEVMRHKGTTLLNNLSIVTVAMREGPKGKLVDIDIDEFERSSNIPITARLALFINTISDELMDKNRQLNEMLYKASHDALTGLLNRGAIENMIYEYEEGVSAASGDGSVAGGVSATVGGVSVAKNAYWHLIMFDVDDFKMINDQCGHVEGDNILKEIAKVLSDYVDTIPGASCGRWGGEEFMIFVTGHSCNEVSTIAGNIHDKIRDGVKRDAPITISVGATRHEPDETVLATITRVDELLYKAKDLGKDQVCSNLKW